jgi:activating signal cointegrator 1
VAYYISLRQPWATLFVHGFKRIETRSWPTEFRGRLAIHAGKGYDQSELDLFYSPPFLEAFEKLEIPMFSHLPRGCLLGWVTITDCLPMVDEPGPRALKFSITDDPRLNNRERAFGHYAPGRYAWITSEQRRVLAKPVALRGFQRIQRLPPDLVRFMSL